jgi:hypothetical protein
MCQGRRTRRHLGHGDGAQEGVREDRAGFLHAGKFPPQLARQRGAEKHVHRQRSDHLQQQRQRQRADPTRPYLSREPDADAIQQAREVLLKYPVRRPIRAAEQVGQQGRRHPRFLAEAGDRRVINAADCLLKTGWRLGGEALKIKDRAIALINRGEQFVAPAEGRLQAVQRASRRLGHGLEGGGCESLLAYRGCESLLAVPGLVVVGGYAGIILALCAWYTSAAGVLNHVFERVVLPLGSPFWEGG